jgi:hypothetical protein
MGFFKIFLDIPIDVVLMLFISSLIYTTQKYSFASKNLKLLFGFLSNFKKTDLNFRFKEIDEWMSHNPYVLSPWMEFKNTLVFSESIALKGQNNNLTYKEVSSTIQYIQTTVDPLYFFEEDSLVTSKFNYKFIQSVSTILTGCGPLFTFLNIALAFGKVTFESQEKTLASLSGFIGSMQTAALVSVVAVSCSLIFIVFEKLAYNNLCKKPLYAVQSAVSKLFDNISSEKFLLELLKETKIQNNALQNMVADLPDNFKVALNSGIASNLVPYLENLIYGMNLLNKNIREAIAANKKDDVDDLF